MSPLRGNDNKEYNNLTVKSRLFSEICYKRENFDNITDSKEKKIIKQSRKSDDERRKKILNRINSLNVREVERQGSTLSRPSTDKKIDLRSVNSYSFRQDIGGRKPFMSDKTFVPASKP